MDKDVNKNIPRDIETITKGCKIKKWGNVPADESETLINIDYYNRTLTFYTTRFATYRKIVKQTKMEPNEIGKINDEVTDVTWIISLSDDMLKKFLSVTNIVGGFRKANTDEYNEDLSQDEELVEEDI